MLTPNFEIIDIKTHKNIYLAKSNVHKQALTVVEHPYPLHQFPLQ